MNMHEDDDTPENKKPTQNPPPARPAKPDPDPAPAFDAAYTDTANPYDVEVDHRHPKRRRDYAYLFSAQAEGSRRWPWHGNLDLKMAVFLDDLSGLHADFAVRLVVLHGPDRAERVLSQHVAGKELFRRAKAFLAAGPEIPYETTAYWWALENYPDESLTCHPMTLTTEIFDLISQIHLDVEYECHKARKKIYPVEIMKEVAFRTFHLNISRRATDQGIRLLWETLADESSIYAGYYEYRKSNHLSNDIRDILFPWPAIIHNEEIDCVFYWPDKETLATLGKNLPAWRKQYAPFMQKIRISLAKQLQEDSK